ncbi:MAG: hypothetical protein RL653_3517 [Pseudomonadota bacterium]
MTVDVVVPVYRDVAMTVACARSVLAHGGPRLGRVLLLDDASPEPGMAEALAGLSASEARVEVFRNARNLGFVRTANRGLSLSRGDVVLLNSDTRVTPGWLDELAAVAGLSERVAAVVPLSNNATLCAVPEFCGDARPEEVPVEALRLQEAEPRVTELPTGVGFCLYLARRALELLGPLDPAYGRGYHEENDWCARARGRGLSILRANRALVYHVGSVSFGAERVALDRFNAERLVRRYPDYLEANRAFAEGPAAHVAALRAAWLLGRPRRAWLLGEPPALVEALRGRGLEANAGLPPATGPWPHACLVGRPVTDGDTFRRVLRAGHLFVRGEAVLEAERGSAEARRLTRALAGAAQAVTVSTDAAEVELQRLGLHLPGAWLRVPGACPGAPAGEAGGRFVAAVQGDGRGELELLLQAYALFRARWSGPGEAPGLLVGGASEGAERVAGVQRAAGAVPVRGALGFLAPVPTWAWPAEALAAAAAGTAVIAPRAGCLPELLGDGAAWTSGWGAPALSEQMARLAQDAAVRRALAEAGAVRACALDAGGAAAPLAVAFERAVLAPAEGPLSLHAGLCAGGAGTPRA